MKSREITNGVLLIILGGLFLADNLGAIPRIPWGTLFQLWPLLIIVAGLQILFPRGILGLVGPLVLLLGVVLVLGNYSISGPFYGSFSALRISIPRPFQFGGGLPFGQFSAFVPVAVIAIGLVLLLREKGGSK